MLILFILLLTSILTIFLPSEYKFISGIIGTFGTIGLSIFNFSTIKITFSLLVCKALNKFSNLIDFHMNYESKNIIKLNEVINVLRKEYQLEVLNDNKEFKIINLKAELSNYMIILKTDEYGLNLKIEEVKVNNNEYNIFENDIRNIQDVISRLLRARPRYYITAKYKKLNPTFSAMFNHIKIDKVLTADFSFRIEKNNRTIDLILNKENLSAYLHDFVELKTFLKVANGVNSYIFKITHYLS